MTYSHGSLPKPAPDASPAAHTASGARAMLPRWFWLIALLVPVLAYAVLPALGISSPGEALNFKLLLAVMAMLVCGSLYWAYLRFVLPRPSLPLGFIVLAWPM